MLVLLTLAAVLDVLGAVPMDTVLAWADSLEVADVVLASQLVILTPAARTPPQTGCATVSTRKLGYLAGALLVASMALRRKPPKEPLGTSDRLSGCSAAASRCP